MPISRQYLLTYFRVSEKISFLTLSYKAVTLYLDKNILTGSKINLLSSLFDQQTPQQSIFRRLFPYIVSIQTTLPRYFAQSCYFLGHY